MEERKDNDRKEIFSERVRAGKRTYFFDVKATRSNDYYLTITESKRRYKDDGYSYEKHKIFLYKEDFNKFLKALNSTVDHVKEELLPEVDFDKFDRDREANYLAMNNGNSSETKNETPTDESATDESATDESATDETATDEATADETTADETTTDETTTDETTTDETSESVIESDKEPVKEPEETSSIESELKWD